MDILRRPYTRRHPRQHHALLVDEYGGFFGSSLLGEQVRLFRREERLHPGCRERLSRRALSSPAQLGRAGVPQPHLLQRARQGRPFRGLGAAGTLLVGGPSCVQITSLDARVRTSAHALARLADLLASLKGKLSRDLDLQVLTPHPAGTAEKGKL